MRKWLIILLFIILNILILKRGNNIIKLFIKKNKENGLDEDSKILFNRLRNVEKDTRLGDYRIGVVSEEIMKEVKEKLKLVLDLED